MKAHELKDREWEIQVIFLNSKRDLQPSRSSLFSGSTYFLRSEMDILKTTLIYSEYDPVPMEGMLIRKVYVPNSLTERVMFFSICAAKASTIVMFFKCNDMLVQKGHSMNIHKWE